MRLFDYEWTSCVPDAPPSLRREGWAMLWAVLDDFRKAREVDTVTLIHERFPNLPPGQIVRIRTAAEDEEIFGDLAGSADATLVIAPETSAILDTRCSWVERVGGRLLGPTAKARQVAGSKQVLGKLWDQVGVRTPRVLAYGEKVHDLCEYPLVLKPDDGAGSQATFLIHNTDELEEALRQGAIECPRTRFIAQHYVPGQAASIAFLMGPKACIPLVAATQLLSADNRLRYLGGTVPLPSPLQQRAAALGRRAAMACAGLRGYVGVDLVLGAAEDGSQDYAIEINPRLTTSYLGLRMLTNDNLAMATLRVALGEDVGKLRWREEVVRFQPDGSLETWPALR
jgi:predicted ATP-grasp superfamily ATP-dependent carboligase